MSTAGIQGWGWKPGSQRFRAKVGSAEGQGGLGLCRALSEEGTAWVKAERQNTLTK